MTRGIPLSAVTAGILPPMIGISGTVALVIRAEQAMGASSAEAASAVAAMCVAIGLTGIALSWRWRMPLVLAWSTPGAALLASSSGHVAFPVAVGAFAIAAALMMLVALLPPLTRLAERIPPALASGMLAGILLPFCLKLFGAVPQDPVFALVMLVTFLLLRAWLPRHALSGSLAIAVIIMLLRREPSSIAAGPLLAHPQFTTPLFDWRSAIGIALPLFLVTLVSQNLPGLVVMQAAGYRPSARWSFLASGAATLFTAPFGGFGINLAAIVAALCTGPDAHPDPDRRWIVGVIYGATWLMLGLVSGLMVGFLSGLPPAVITVITGIALLGPLVSAVLSLSANATEIDAGVVTLVIAASGMSLLGVGSAFWALVAGFTVIGSRHLVRRQETLVLCRAASLNPPTGSPKA
ncbi:MAG TPA: benzoate/H(+) symporter BenE family transporter [Sphingomicrobium sp.]|nr:benzoate/H(+) symporter BenE family transporter [Sphingomicrobium sp.]